MQPFPSYSLFSHALMCDVIWQVQLRQRQLVTSHVDRSRFPLGVQYIFRFYSVPFTAYRRFLFVDNGGLSIAATREHLKHGASSSFDSPTTVSYRCLIHIIHIRPTCLARTIQYFKRLNMHLLYTSRVILEHSMKVFGFKKAVTEA